MRERAGGCPACGAPVTGELGGTLCAACLLALALDEDEEADGEAGASNLPVHAYQVVSVLGRERGRVRYLARRQDFHAFVSLELVSPAALAGMPPGAVETRLGLLRSLRHPAIARLLESWMDASGDWCLVSDYLAGRMLSTNPRQPPAGDTSATAATLSIFDRVCQALSFAHSHGVLHGRLEPASVVLVGADTDAGPCLTGFTLTSSPPTLADDLAGLGRILAALTIHTPLAAEAAVLADQAVHGAFATVRDLQRAVATLAAPSA